MTTNTHTFIITGMDCADCAKSIERGVAQLPGVTTCTLNFTNARLRVVGTIATDTVIARVQALGYGVGDAPTTPVVHTTPPSFVAYMWQRRETQRALFGALLISPCIVLSELLGWERWWLDLLAIVALLCAVPPILQSAWRSIWINRELSINVLMTIAACGAIALGQYVEAGMVVVLFAIGEALEGYSSHRARAAVSSMFALVPERALRQRHHADGETVEQLVLVSELAVGDTVVVRPGERFPCDGSVARGESLVDEALLTGESHPVAKTVGDTVYAGSINGLSPLLVTIRQRVDESMVARMTQLVADAQERRAPVEHLVDRFARYYTPAVFILAVLVAMVPPLLWGAPWWSASDPSSGWLYRGLALLVVACPCALVISVPVALVSALSNAARHGILVKGGAILSTLAQVRAIAFDKTGTLTNGTPSVVSVRTSNCAFPAHPVDTCSACIRVLALADAVERHTTHPLAHAIVRASPTHLPVADNVTTQVGYGVRGDVAGVAVFVGSHHVFDRDIPHDSQHCAAADVDSQNGFIPLMVSENGHYVGTITVADAIRPQAPAALMHLQQLGINSISMLTGDNARVANHVATQLGITQVYAGLLPADKVATVRSIHARDGLVAMVGDGINDTPALAGADVGIAMAGTHHAMEVADVALIHADIQRIPQLIQLSRITMRTVITNITVSIAIKALFLLIVLLGHANMWMAIVADVGTTLVVTAYGLRLLYLPLANHRTR